MDFQTHQDQAKQSTTKLLVLFMGGVISTIVLVSVLVTGLLAYTSNEFQPLPAVAVAAPITLLAMGGTSASKASQIRRGGGSYVATSMGGRQIDFNTLEPAERQLSNIVEEIAIASGMAVPAVFVLDDEPGINAFAAGWTADNAVIGVTRGALQHLTRAELQGVIAHEFAHIGNGDTKIKTRIIGWVFGIAILTVLGRILLQTVRFAPGQSRRSNRDNNSGNLFIVLLVAAVGLMIIGAVGSFFAKMIQAAVSRERELLADASAVQFTRNPDGLASALQKIGGLSDGNAIHSAHSTESSHLFFSSALSSRFATHPPLKVRIARLMPGWDGTFKGSESTQTHPQPRQRPSAADGSRGPGQMLPGQVMIPGMPGAALPVDPTILIGAALSGGQSYQAATLDGPTQRHIDYARELLSQIPNETQQYLQTQAGAVASLLGLLITTDGPHRQADLQLASARSGLDIDYLESASGVISDLPRPLQLPAIDLALRSVRQTHWEFKQGLVQTVLELEHSRPEQDLFRWMLRRVIIRHLQDQQDAGRDTHNVLFANAEQEAIFVFAVIAMFNSSGPEAAAGAFTAALISANLAPRELASVGSPSVEVVDAALDKLSHLNLEGRRRFVTAAMAIVAHDQATTADEAELIRVVADAVRLPVPPLLPN